MVSKEVELTKKGKMHQLWIGIGLLLMAIIIIMIIMVNAMNGKETGDVVISGETTINGLICKDKTLAHPAFSTKPAISYVNTITAIFRDDKLSSISLLSEAFYETEQLARGAEASAMADYNLTLNRKYNEDDDIFSRHFTVNGVKLQLAQTTRDISKINSNTVVYFLLDQGTNISRSFSELKKQYENKGFSCEKSK